MIVFSFRSVHQEQDALPFIAVAVQKNITPVKKSEYRHSKIKQSPDNIHPLQRASPNQA